MGEDTLINKGLGPNGTVQTPTNAAAANSGTTVPAKDPTPLSSFINTQYAKDVMAVIGGANTGLSQDDNKKMWLLMEHISPGGLKDITEPQWKAIAAEFKNWVGCSGGLHFFGMGGGREDEVKYLKSMAKIVLYGSTRKELTATEQKPLDALAGAGNFFKALFDELDSKISKANAGAAYAELAQIVLNTIVLNYGDFKDITSNPSKNVIEKALASFYGKMKEADSADRHFEFDNKSRNKGIARDVNGAAVFNNSTNPLNNFLDTLIPSNVPPDEKEGARVGAFIALLKRFPFLEHVHFDKLGRKELAIFLRYAAQQIKASPVTGALIEKLEEDPSLKKLAKQLEESYPDPNKDKTSWVLAGNDTSQDQVINIDGKDYLFQPSIPNLTVNAPVSEEAPKPDNAHPDNPATK